MAKNKKNLAEPTEINAPLASKNLSEASVAVDSKNINKKNIKKNEKPNFFKRIGRSFQEMWSELKKVSWLTPKSTFAKLGTVLVVVLVFLLVVMGFDALCSYLLQLLIQVK